MMPLDPPDCEPSPKKQSPMARYTPGHWKSVLFPEITGSQPVDEQSSQLASSQETEHSPIKRTSSSSKEDAGARKEDETVVHS